MNDAPNPIPVDFLHAFEFSRMRDVFCLLNENNGQAGAEKLQELIGVLNYGLKHLPPGEKPGELPDKLKFARGLLAKVQALLKEPDAPRAPGWFKV